MMTGWEKPSMIRPMNHFLVFGNHPRLSLAELHAVKPDIEMPITVAHGALVEDAAWNGAALMDLLGGTVKLGDIVQTMPLDDVSEQTFVDIITSEARAEEANFGFSVIGGTKGPRGALEQLPIRIKRALKEHGMRSRWVTGKEGTLSPAAVEKLKLTSEGYDFVIFLHDGNVHVGLTTHVQNADAWSDRDYGRPSRDDKAGMLPPKLARMMVNLAQIKKGATVLDPFCGNGTLAMETALATRAGEIVNADIDAKQVASTKTNFNWLVQQGIVDGDRAPQTQCITSDVRDLAKHLQPDSIDVVVTEGALGPPLRGGESLKEIERNKWEIDTLWKDALAALKPLLKEHARLVIIWPSFKTDAGIARVGLDAAMEALGYRILNPLGDWDESGNPLIYHRQGQRVARRIVVLETVDKSMSR